MKPLPLNQILDSAKIRAIRVQAAVVRDGEFFLAGGTALGLRLRHRRSRDLDWFTSAGFDAAHLGKTLDGLSEKPTKMEQHGPTTIRVYYGELETSFIRYTQVSAAPESLNLSGVEIPVADMNLIAAMKAAAVHDRGRGETSSTSKCSSTTARWTRPRCARGSPRSSRSQASDRRWGQVVWKWYVSTHSAGRFGLTFLVGVEGIEPSTSTV